MAQVFIRLLPNTMAEGDVMPDKQFLSALSDELHAREPRLDNECDFLRSAVLVPLLRKEDGLHVLFEVRAQNLSRQPGEICFPGGRIERDDLSPLAAALRESEEELAIPRESVRVLGPLPYLISPIGVMVYPFAGFLTNNDSICPNSEVAECFSVPLDFLLATKPIVGHMEVATQPLPDVPLDLLSDGYSREWRRRTTYPVWFYRYEKYVIWGLTGRVLYTFLETCRRL